jgi:hypothetical protein
MSDTRHKRGAAVTRLENEWFGHRAAAPRLKELLNELADLDELDENLNEVLDTFAVHFRTASDTEVVSQFDAYKKAQAGLRAAESVLASLRDVLQQYPDDKTANRALRDAEVMVARFTRNKEKTLSMRKRLGKKLAPPALKAAGVKTVKAFRKLLEDPKSLTTRLTSDAGTWKGVKGARYIQKIRIALEGTQDLVIVMIQSTVWNKNKVTIMIGMEGEVKWWDIAVATTMFMEAMEGKPELKGEGNKISERLRVVPEIAQEMGWYANKMGDTYNREPEISADGRTIEVSFRTEYDERDYGQYEEPDFPDYTPGMKTELSEYMGGIKSISGDYGEKGWFYITVELK